MDGLEGTADGVDEVALDGVQLDGLAQPRGEGGHDCFGRGERGRSFVPVAAPAPDVSAQLTAHLAGTLTD